MSEYLVYWRPKTVNYELEHGASLGHAASDQFGKVNRGDHLWVVTCIGGKLFLCGHQEVGDKTGQREANRRLGEIAWKGKYHTFDASDQSEPIRQTDITSIAGSLRFVGGVDRLPLNFSGSNLQTIRLLTPETAARLRQVWYSEDGAKAANFPEQEVEKIPDEGSFDPQGLADARKRILREIVDRRGQQAFRATLLDAYDGRCAISDCAVEDVLEAAHIRPYWGQVTNHVSNGLLLRTDLHTLFDLGLIGIDTANFRIIVASKLLGSEYARFGGKPLRLPSDVASRPSVKALDWHLQFFGLKMI